MTSSSSSSYYGRPILKAPVWKWYIPAYFFTGGLAAGTSLLAAGARLTGDNGLARRCLFASSGAVAVSTVLLVADLGRPRRFLNMLRVAKPTSPMSVGSWVLAAFGSATTAAAAGELFGVARPLARVAEGAAAGLAPVLGTYTAVLVADTAVPAWHDARQELPFVFAGGALASSGGLAMVLSRSAPARRAAILGAALELAATRAMERQRLRSGHAGQGRRSGWLSRAASAATLAGGVLAATAARRHRAVAVVAGGLLMAGAATERFAVFGAGVASARDPSETVAPQRRRLSAKGPTAAPA